MVALGGGGEEVVVDLAGRRKRFKQRMISGLDFPSFVRRST